MVKLEKMVQLVKMIQQLKVIKLKDKQTNKAEQSIKIV